MSELVSILTEGDFRKRVYRNVIQIIVKGVRGFCSNMTTDPQTRYAASHGSHYDGHSGVAGALVLALVMAGLLVAVSYPVVTLAVVAGALAPTAGKTVSAKLASLRPVTRPTVTPEPRRSRELSD
jgi:hypothetical protein